MYRRERKMSRKPNTLQALILQGLQQPRPFFLLCRVISVNPKKLKILKALILQGFELPRPFFLLW